MTYNIRLDATSDTKNGWGWEDRKEDVISTINAHNPGIFGVQEALFHQMNFLDSSLPGYAYTGVGRDDGKEKGEFSAIFFAKDRFELIDQNTFWLSETPEKPSKSWDAALPRICTWAYFRDKEKNLEFYHFNTHFDHVGVQARLKSAELIVQKIKELTGDKPVILTGDFNFTPDADPYRVIVQYLNDAYLADAENNLGPEGTFSGFVVDPAKEMRRIDYIFYKGFKVEKYEVVADMTRSRHPSDHLPVVVSFQ